MQVSYNIECAYSYTDLHVHPNIQSVTLSGHYSVAHRYLGFRRGVSVSEILWNTMGMKSSLQISLSKFNGES